MLRKLIIFAGLGGLLSGCVIPGSVSVPTPYPAGYIPTVIYLTAQSINATRAAGIVTPTIEAPTATAPVIVPTAAPTDAPTAAPGTPLAAIQINVPGPMSKIVSPVEVHVLAVAGDSHQIEVALFDETGQVISRTVRLVPGNGEGDPVSLKIPFEIRAAGENGVVQVSTKDRQGRVQSLSSVQVLLLSSGASQINPPGNTIYERAVFYNLAPDATVSGGVVSLEGRFEPYNRKPAVLELVGDDGKSLGLRVLNFSGSEPQHFQTTIPYKVDAETHARLYLYQDDQVINGRAYVYSQEITLDP